MMTTRVNTGKYKIPLKLRTPKAGNLAQKAGTVETAAEMKQDIDISELNDTLEMINDNYDTFRTIFSAPDDINVNKEIKQEAAGFIIRLFNPKTQLDKDPIILPEYKYNPWPRDLASFIEAGSFDEVEYNKNKGEWRDKNINDFKRLFD
ncbi:MAG: hypothetical protein IKA36_01970 [Clostridia bacterium]|nr:hypothetical protein [Clostridia bacterium]